MLIDRYDLDIFTPPCDPGATRFSAKALLTVDITPVLPYLNAVLRGALYTPAAGALTWKNGRHNTAFRAYEIGASNLEDRDAALKELKELVELVNRTWERRAEIAPDTTTRERPTAMALYKLLPRMNCRECGQPSCWNFALKLATGQVELAACPLLWEPAHAERRTGIEALLSAMPVPGTRS